MNIVNMNEGEKAAFAVDGAELLLGDLLIDLSAAQEDTEQVISVYVDAAGGFGFSGDAYAAVIVIPPRRYGEEEITEMEGDEEVTLLVPVPLPFEPGAVTLQLWALPEAAAHQTAPETDPEE